MVFAVDIGNSSIKLAVLDDNGNLIFRSSMASVKYKTVDEYAIAIFHAMEMRGFKPENISGAIIASVVPPLTKTIGEAITSLLE